MTADTMRAAFEAWRMRRQDKERGMRLLTQDEINEYRRTPGSFEAMVQAIHDAGWAEGRNIASEQALAALAVEGQQWDAKTIKIRCWLHLERPTLLYCELDQTPMGDVELPYNSITVEVP